MKSRIRIFFLLFIFALFAFFSLLYNLTNDSGYPNDWFIRGEVAMENEVIDGGDDFTKTDLMIPVFVLGM